MAQGEEAERGAWQTELETRFITRGVDASLIAAIAYEPEQTFDGACAILEALASANEVEPEITNSNTDIESQDLSNKEDNTTEEASSSSGTPIEDETVEQLLQEWKLVDIESNLAENLNVTDEEEGNDDLSSGPQTRDEKESARIGEAAGQGLIDVDKIAAGKEESAYSAKSEAIDNHNEDDSGLAFLIHAFPSRTPIFLHEILSNEKGNVEMTIETLMVMEMAENDQWEESGTDEEQKTRSHQPGLDYDLLEKGTAHHKSSKNQRKRRKQQLSLVDAVTESGKERSQKINLTDVRQGGPSVSKAFKKMPANKHDSHTASRQPNDEDDAAMAARLDKEERKAAGLPLPGEESTVQDNDWLFSSSILEQLSTILDIPSHKVKSVHNACHFNLRATTQRLINLNCQEYPSLVSLDEAGNSPSGTASSIVDGMTLLMPTTSRAEVERLFRGSKGRQDATLDLVQLIALVEKSAMGEKSDALDPMMASRNRPSAMSNVQGTSEVLGNRQGNFKFVGKDVEADIPSEVPYSLIARRGRNNNTQTASRKFALEKLRAGAASTSFPLHSAHAQAASNVRSSPSSLFDGPRKHETQSEAEKLSLEYRAIADDYRIRREESLRQAASAYRSLPGGGASKQIRGAAAWVYADQARRLDAKARAFSLESARTMVRHRIMSSRIDANGNNPFDSPTSSTPRHSPDIVDLHGLTVHESLSITKEALSAWWSKSSSGSVRPLHIVTGVGRHSRGHVAVIRPAILKMLQHEGWIVDERSQGQITVKGLR